LPKKQGLLFLEILTQQTGIPRTTVKYFVPSAYAVLTNSFTEYDLFRAESAEEEPPLWKV
jgi:hypothetical protein